MLTMTSAGLWGAIPQAEGVAQIAQHTIEKIEDDRPHSSNELSGSSSQTETYSDLEKIGSTHEVAKLAKQLTHQSSKQLDDEKKLERVHTSTSIKTVGGAYRNSFLDASDPALDPHSGQFKPEAWVRTLIGLQSRDPERYPQRVAGVGYRNLNVHGFGGLTDYQKYVGQRRPDRLERLTIHSQDLWQLPLGAWLHLQQTDWSRKNKDTNTSRF